ncbi:Lipid A 3-O-deacylase (PagL) [Duganella sacchari]|uniref:Lipid A deacylase n=1 Tax=Duganella sacchari TaxID=551987 RepID=A0A1M7RFP7_9BURK|nr:MULTISPECIES: acyloxyacyl hydrolase [Duganella]MYM29627.1 acyloxyacyl hydrolase [Duganella sp. CY15W]SHN44868.1 Lipid A 3-O-deacylase (PagL) [Duganella sacchari]
MFAKTMMAVAAALVVAQSAYADDKLIDSVSIDYGTAAKVRMERLSVAKDWNVQWFQSNGTHLSGYWEASVGFWQQKQYMNISGNDKNLWDIGFTPVFRFQNDNKKGMYYEGGIGVHRLSDLYNNDTYRLSTLFQFGDHIGVGYVFDNKWEVGAKVQHFSNGGYKKPNTGINYIEVKAAYHF